LSESRHAEINKTHVLQAQPLENNERTKEIFAPAPNTALFPGTKTCLPIPLHPIGTHATVQRIKLWAIISSSLSNEIGYLTCEKPSLSR